MSATYASIVVIDGHKVTENIDGLDNAKQRATELAAERSLRINATDWYRDAAGSWHTRKALEPAICVTLVPARRVSIPRPRQSTETR